MGRLSRHDQIVAALLGWSVTSLRELPWRTTNDPWCVLVSEVMLQQTSVARVLPKYEAFIERFPTATDLANSSLGEALVLWQGLGYPRRCRNLKAAAEAVVARHGGVIPSTLEELLALPGIGQYTARAVLAFAHRQDVAVVDVNVSRVLSRLQGAPMTARMLQEFADELVPIGSSWEWNQAMMDFGANVCSVRSPSCRQCPVKKWCKWKGVGEDPAPRSAGASRPQARFEGSDRQARGRALRALTAGEQTRCDVIDAMGVPAERAQALLDALVSEGLVHRVSKDRIRLP